MQKMSAPLLLTHSIHFSSQRSPKFMNQSPTPSPHQPYLFFLPGNSQAPLSQSFNPCLRKRFIRSLPNKSYPLDSLPTSLLKKYVLILSLILSKLANLSFSTGTFPCIFKRAQVLSFLKSLVWTSLRHYQPPDTAGET